jgi:hypothetical protein
MRVLAIGATGQFTGLVPSGSSLARRTVLGRSPHALDDFLAELAR